MIATRDGNAGVRDVPSVSGLTHVVTVVHLTERGDTGVKMLGGHNEFYLLHVSMNDYADFRRKSQIHGCMSGSGGQIKG